MGKLHFRRGRVFSFLAMPMLFAFLLMLAALVPENATHQNGSGAQEFFPPEYSENITFNASVPQEFVDVDGLFGNGTSEITVISPEENNTDEVPPEEPVPPEEISDESEAPEEFIPVDELINETAEEAQPEEFVEVDELIEDSALGGPALPGAAQLDIPRAWAGERLPVIFSIKGSEGEAFPAEIALGRAGSKLSFGVGRGVSRYEIPGGKYSVEITPGRIQSKSGKEMDFVPVRRILLHDADVSGGVELGLESLNSNALPFGKTAVQAYAIDPARISFDYGEAEIIARGTELYKCAEWDFEARECHGEWAKLMDLVPGEGYTITFNSTDPAYAEYSPLYGVPVCTDYSSPCIADSDDLRSRDSLATPEPNQPNTLDACADGTLGTYMTDESVENITITSLNGSIFNAEDWVNVTAWVYCWDAASDNVNFVYSNSSASPSWRVVGFTDPCPGPGFVQVSVQFQLDNLPGYHAVRVINQYNGVTTATCGAGNYDDNDDLVFRVNGTYAAQAQDAIIAYRSNTGINGLNSPKIRFWNSSGTGTWGPAIELSSAGSPVRWAVAKWSPVAYKVAVITLSDDGNLDAYVCMENCDLAGNWRYSSNIGNVWATAAAQRRYDFDFETITGDLMVVYGVNSAVTTQDLAYKLLPANATSFSGIAEQYIDDSGHGTDLVYTWVRIARKPTVSEEMIVIGFDSTNTDINAWVWNGSIWANQTSISETATATGGYEALAAAYSYDGTQGMAIGGDGTTGNVNTRYWNGSVWSATSTFDVDPGDNNDLRWANLKADPALDDLQAVCVDSGNDLGTAYWSGSAWAVTANIDAGLDLSTSRLADFGWNGTTSTGVLVWDTDGAGTTLSQRRCAPQCTGATTTFSTYAGTGAWITMFQNPKASAQQVKILSARLNSAFDIGSFLYDGTAYGNYGDGIITADTTVTTFEAYSIAFNITDTIPPSINFTHPTPANGSVLYADYVFINTSITDNMGVHSALLEWNGTNQSMNYTSSTNWYLNKTGLVPGQEYIYRVWARDYAGNWNVSEARTLTYGTPPVVIVVSPLGEEYGQHRLVPIAANITDPDGINVSIATVTYPNGTLENLTLYQCRDGDDFDFNTMDLGWRVENDSVGPMQACVADISTTAPLMAYTSISGDGTPFTDTLCTIISHNAVFGDFDMEISFEVLARTGNDTSINFQVTEQPTSSQATRLAFIALSEWSGMGLNYEVFADDGNNSGYLSTRETGDSSGKMRISREGNEFSFYTWNNTDSSWILESSANLSLSKALFVSFESESAYSGWGAINASWDNFTTTHNNYTYAIFNNTDLLGLYNVSFYVRDQKGSINDSEKTNFTIIQVNDPPSTPFILAPSPGSRIYGLFNITWSEVYDEEGDNVWFNITLLNPDYSFNYSIASNYGNISSVMHEWNTSEVPDGFYSMQVLVFENETVERLSNQYTLPGTFEINNTPNVPPSLIVLSPLGETYVDRKPVSIAANITDIDGINESYAIITFPNGTTENLTLAQCSGGDKFDMDTVGMGWQVENISIGPSQACTANINGTIPGKAYTYLTGDGSPYTNTLCSLVSMRAIYGDFDMNVSFEILDETGVDNAINFQVMELGTSAEASLLAFISLSNWTGLGRNYEVFVDDGEISDYIATVPSDDTYGKMRIRREGGNFTFFVWNNTDSSWIELNSTELNLTSSLYVAIESESAYSGWGTMGASWDNLSIAHDDTYFNVFNSRVHPVGLYNVSFYARDNRGGVNDTERSNFTIIDANDPPSKPYILAPYPGATVQGPYNITWSGVSDPDGDSLQFNITLLNPDGSDNATIVSDYGNDSSVRYEWDTTLFPDGEYSMRIIVFENETAEHLSNHYTIPGTFFINNNVPSVIVLHPLGGEYPERRPISISINASDPDGIAYAIAEITLPNGSKENLTLGEGLGSDDFDFDTMGINWTEESYETGPFQTCNANIDGTIPGKAYTSLVGDGTPETDTFCTIISEKALDGDFDIWIDFNIEEEAGADYAANFQITRVQSSAGAIQMIFISLSNWTGLGRNYEIFADDGNFSDYILSRPTDDTSGKMRIKREGNNFTFYTWNNSAADWNEEEVDRNEFDFARGVYVSFESESAYPGWGNISVGWDNFTVQGSGSMFGMFNNTFELGPYNVSFHVGDHVGGVNDSERTNFTIAHLNTPPSKPYLLAPFPGEAVGGPYNITWSEVNDYDDDSVQFNITLLNPDGSDNATLVSNYGNITSTTYGWDTHLFEDGLYSMRISVFENETAELLGNEYTMLGNFTINNNALSINNISAAPDPSGYWFNITITANVTGANLVLAGITPPGGAESNHTMVSSTPGIYEYVYSTWANGTYIYTIYATDIFSHAQNASGNFSVYQNLSIQVRTTQDYYPANTQINITDPPGPSIISAHVLPEKVIPGDTMRISVTVYDHAGVRSVTAYMPHDLGEDEVPFSLVNGTETYGVWEADWLVHDTSPREYFSTIVAENTLGQRSEKEVRWFDPPGAWILPNGDYDPTGQWTTRADARDGNTDTYSSDNSNPGGGWGTYIYLNTTMIDSEKVRVWADYGPEVNAVDIDVYNGTWVDAYQGPISNLAWFEANFSRTNITEGRFRFNYSVGGWIYWLYEFQFYNITVTVTKPAAVTQAATSIEETSAILHGLITNDGGSDCQVRFVYGNDTSFQNSTMWYSPRYTGDQLNVRLTGLENGQAYYYLIQVNNSAGLSNGSILSFTTGPAPVGWVSPTGYDDPAGRWEQEEYAFDDSLITSAQSYHVSGDPNGVWSSYLYLNRSPAVISSRVRFNAKSVDIDRASIDIYNGTAWINVFNSSFAGQTWVSAYFNQTNVSQARIQFRVDSNSKGLYWRLYEFDFYKDSMTPYPNQSLLSNMGNPGNTNASCLLFMKTQFWNGSGWLDDDIVVNESTPRVLEPLDVIKLDSIWNPLNYSTNNLSFGDGTYRVYAACLDNESNVLMNLGGDYVNSSHNFTYDTTPPLVIIVSPPNGSDWNLTNTIPIWVNVTDMLGISSVQANVSNAIGSEIVVLAYNSTSGYWEYPYSNTNYPGLYTIRIIATGLAGNVNDTEFVQVNVNDVIPPTVILAAPPDNHTYNTTTSLPVNFTCNATDDFNLNNISLYITDSTNSSFSLNATQPVSGAQASATFQLDLAPGTYTWNCDAYDSSGNRGWGESNRTLFIQRAITNCAYLSIPGSNYSLSADLFANKTDSICITIDAPGITLDCAGFSITGAGGNTSGIAIINSSGVRIENCIVSNYSSAFLLQNANDSYLRNNTGFNSEYGFYVDPSYNNTIIENQAFNNSIDGLKLEYSHNNSIINNSAYNNSNNGIYLYWSDENALRGNTAHENSGMGLFLQSSSGNNLTVNAAYGNGEGFFLDVSSGNSLVGNSAYSNLNSGFFIYTDSDNNRLEGNNASGNGDEGFFLEGAGWNNLTGNSAYENGAAGFYLLNSTGTILAYNNVTNNSGFGIAYYHSNYTSIGHNILEYNQNDSITGNYSSHVNISYNRIAYGREDAIFNFVSVGSIISHNTISDHLGLSGLWDGASAIDGIDVPNNTGTILHGNNISTVDVGVRCDFCVNVLINDTRIGDAVLGVGSAAMDGCNITENSISDSTYAIFLIGSAENAIVEGNELHGNTYGYYLSTLASSNFSGNTIHGNTYGIYLLNSSGNIFAYEHIYNNTFGFVANSTSDAMMYNLSGAIFDNPAGGFQNYTNISIDDVLEVAPSGQAVEINWNQQPAPLPIILENFNYKYVNITALAGPVSIDSVTWHWQEPELTGFNESKLEIWKYNASGWALLNYSPDTINNRLSLSNLNPASTYGILSDQFPPNIIWISQDPADISAFNVFDRSLNITYNITDPSYVNWSSITMYYKTNSSTSDCLFYLNGSYLYCGWQNRTFHSNTSADDFLWRFWDNEIYPGTYNFPEREMETTPHSAYALLNPNYMLKIQLLNVSNQKQYGVFEIMANTSQTRELQVYYCNSSYVSGTVFTSQFCTLIYTIDHATPFNHSHSNYSLHHTVPFTMNATSGTIGGVYVTPVSYFIIRPTLTGSGSWNAWYISNISRADAYQTSTNVGNAWSNFAGTFDAHLHQYDGTDAFRYYVCAADNVTNYNCSEERFDYINLTGIPPTSPFVYSPTNGTYCGNIPINYTQSVSPNGYGISFYNITLLNSSGDYNATITANNSLNLSYLWDTSGIAPGEYAVRVYACDVFGQCSYGDSELFNFTGPCGIGNCPIINSSGEYIQPENYFGAPNSASPLSDYVCVKITASNVLYDCNGYNITDNGTSSFSTSYGILTTSVSNVTIRNCPGISNYTYGAYLYETNGSLVTNSTAFNSSYGFHMTGSRNNAFANCTAYNISSNGFYIYLNSAGNTISGCTAFDSLTGFATAYTSAGNYIENNTAYSNTYGFIVSFDASANRLYNNTARDNSLYGFEVFRASNSSFISNRVYDSSAQGFYVHESNHTTLSSNTVNFSFAGFWLNNAYFNNLTSNTAHNNTNDGFSLSGSGNNTLSSNLAYNNGQHGASLVGASWNTLALNNFSSNVYDGIIFSSVSPNNTLSSNYVCFNQNVDMNNNAQNNSGEPNTCDSYSSWEENGHPGCTYTCTEIWHRFYGNVSGNLFLAPNNAEIFYSWIWNGQGGRVYALNGDATIQWINLTALGRNVSGGNSTNDFEELDFLLGYSALTLDNVNATFSSDGSNPKRTDTFNIFKRLVPHVPIANSTLYYPYTTGIAWDASQGGPEFNTTLNQDVVFVNELNTSQDHNYYMMVPGTLDTYKGTSNVVEVWVELD